MRYLVKAKVKPGRARALLQAIQDGSLGRGSVAGDEYVYDKRLELSASKDYPAGDAN